MRIVIMGAGGVGGYFGGRLALAGNDMTFVARGPHGEAIRRNGPNRMAGRNSLFPKCGLVASKSMVRTPLRPMSQ